LCRYSLFSDLNIDININIPECNYPFSIDVVKIDDTSDGNHALKLAFDKVMSLEENKKELKKKVKLLFATINKRKKNMQQETADCIRPYYY
jgi:hypothetical protein